MRFLSGIYVWFFRGTPVIVQIFFVYFGANLLFGFTLIPTRSTSARVSLDGAVIAGILALGINEGAYMREIIRAGIDAIDKGQMEAAKSLGMTLRPRDAAHRAPAGGAGDRAAARQRVQQHAEDDVAALLRSACTSCSPTRSQLLDAFQPVEYFLGVAFWYLVLTTVWTLHPGRGSSASWRSSDRVTTS